MGKIHIRGGCPLELEFRDFGASMEVELVKVEGEGGPPRYNVQYAGTHEKLQTVKGEDGCVFRTGGPNWQTVVVDYKSPERDTQ